MTQKVGHMTELYREHQFFSETSILLFGSAAKIFFFLEFYQVETSAVRTFHTKTNRAKTISK